MPTVWLAQIAGLGCLVLALLGAASRGLGGTAVMTARYLDYIREHNYEYDRVMGSLA